MDRYAHDLVTSVAMNVTDMKLKAVIADVYTVIQGDQPIKMSGDEQTLFCQCVEGLKGSGLPRPFLTAVLVTFLRSCRK